MSNDYRAYIECDYNSLYHHGIKGMKWGVRRYVNENGTLTPEGRRRYGKIYDTQIKRGRSKKAAANAVKRYRKSQHIRNAYAAAMAGLMAYSVGGIAKGLSNQAKYANRKKAAFTPHHHTNINKVDKRYAKHLQDMMDYQSQHRKVPSTFVEGTNKLGPYKGLVKKGLSKRGKIGVAIGATALGAAAGYGIYKRKKKKRSNER